MDFVAIDFETANEDLASICQVGMVSFVSGAIEKTYSTLINPEDSFSPINSAIHGITEKDIIDAPSFPEVFNNIIDILSNKTVVSHTAFDRTALYRAIERYSLPRQDFIWLDSARVARRAWEKYAHSGYGLSAIAKDIGIEFKHHDALEDARASGLIMIEACHAAGKDIGFWMDRVKKPINSPESYNKSIVRAGSVEGPLYGENIVFTGSLSIPRREAADLAAKAGCNVSSSLTKKTSLLVVGDQDIKKLRPGAEKSAKHLKAEKLIKDGVVIRIMQESDFLKTLALN